MITNGTRFLEYDDENQLIRITEPNSWKSEFTYDGKLRLRIQRHYTWSNSTWIVTNEVRYVYEGNLVIQERDANNLAAIAYTRGKDFSGTLERAGGIGGLLAFSQLATSPRQDFYYHADGNGNVTMLINGLQRAGASCLCDPFGTVLSLAGPAADINRYRFSSKPVDSASGLLWFLYRYYDSRLQRWVNTDPLRACFKMHNHA